MSINAENILSALGGAENIIEIEPCITRLRTVVKNPDVVDDGKLKAAGAHGVMRMGDIIQVVVGPQADIIAEDIEDLL